MKTNDIRGIFMNGVCGIAAEMGRPGVSTKWTEVEKVAMACAKVPGVEFADGKPCHHGDGRQVRPANSTRRSSTRDSISAIIEMKVPREKVGDVLETLKKVSTEIDTVFSMDIIDRPVNTRTEGQQAACPGDSR